MNPFDSTHREATDTPDGPAEAEPAAVATEAGAPPADAGAARFDRRDVLWLAAIVVLALGLRLVHNRQMAQSPLFDHPILDAEIHDRWARAILEGESMFPGAYFKAPLYPWFLSAVYAVGDGSYMAPRIAQAILGALSCGLIYLLGREVFGRRAVGAIAGLGCATYWIMIYFDGELKLEPLGVFLNLLALLAIFRASRHEGLWRWAVAGLLLGVSAINRPNILPFVPVVCLWALFLKGPWLKGLARATIVGLACLLPILPVTARNLVIGEDFVLIASQGGANFYIGNNPESDGMSARMPGARTSWGGGYSDWISLAEQTEGRKLKPSEVDQFFYDRAWEWIHSDRVGALDLAFRKLQLFFWEGEIVNNQDMHFMTRHFGSIVNHLPLTTGMILPLALLGFFMCLRQPWKMLPLWSFVAIYTLTIIAFFVCSRFRLPVMPLAILMAAFALVRIWDTLRERQIAPVVGYLILVGLFWKGVNRGVPEEFRAREAARALCQLGLAYGQSGERGAEKRSFEKALEVDPRCTDAEAALGFLHMRDKDYATAARHFTNAVMLNPSTDVYESLATALVMQGQWGEAIDRLEQGVEIYHGYLDLKRKLAFVLSTCPEARYRDGQKALRLAEEVRRVGSEIPETYDTLGVAYAELGRYEDALRAARHGLALAQQSLNMVAIEEIGARIRLYEQGLPFRQKIP